MHTIKTLALALLIAVGSQVKADSTTDEIPPPTMMFIRGGILCDTEEDLKTFLTKASLNGGNFVENHGTTCGRFVPRTPVPMMVTPTEWYVMPDARILIAHFFFAHQMWEQWGYVSFVPTGDSKPPDKGA